MFFFKKAPKLKSNQPIQPGPAGMSPETRKLMENQQRMQEQMARNQQAMKNVPDFDDRTQAMFKKNQDMLQRMNDWKR